MKKPTYINTPHAVAIIFGALLIWVGVSVVSTDVGNPQIAQAGNWQFGLGAIIFGAMIVGAALSKIAENLRKERSAR